MRDSEQLRPVLVQVLEGVLGLIEAQVARDHRPDRLLVDRLRVGGVELGVGEVLPVAEHEDDLLRFASPGASST